MATGAEFDIKTLAVAASPLDVMPWRLRIWSSQFTGGYGQFTGDSSYDAGPAIAGTSSLFVTTVDACTWQVTSYTNGVAIQTLSKGENAATQTEPRIVLLTEAGAPGTTQAVIRGHFLMPFAATIRVIGGRSGCPL
jgi:hypothetical protein